MANTYLTNLNEKTLNKSLKLKLQEMMKYIKKHRQIYLLLIPGLIYLIIFKYIPLSGLCIAFQDYNIFEGISGSQWVGLKNFQQLFQSPKFYDVFKNTLIISFLKIVFLFPFPIFVALLINEIRSIYFKRSIQTVIYLPHFLSWVIIAGLFTNILSPSSGLVNNIIEFFGGKPIAFMMEKSIFRWVLVYTQGWKEVGWNAIIYIAAIASIDPQLYESAKMDGAGRVKQIIHITIPSIAPTIVLLFILKLGHVLDAGFQQVLVMYNSVVYDVADIIDTYVYRIGLGKMNYSFSTAVGFFKSLIGFILVYSGNLLSKKITEKSIW